MKKLKFVPLIALTVAFFYQAYASGTPPETENLQTETYGENTFIVSEFMHPVNHADLMYPCGTPPETENLRTETCGENTFIVSEFMYPANHADLMYPCGNLINKQLCNERTIYRLSNKSNQQCLNRIRFIFQSQPLFIKNQRITQKSTCL